LHAKSREASLRANHLLENAHALNRLTPLPLGVVIRDPDFWEKTAGSVWF
jgi:hypothetical protein